MKTYRTTNKFIQIVGPLRGYYKTSTKEVRGRAYVLARWHAGWTQWRVGSRGGGSGVGRTARQACRSAGWDMRAALGYRTLKEAKKAAAVR